MTIRIPDSALKEIAHLRAEIQRLREHANEKVAAIKCRLNLTANEARIVALLSDGHVHTRERIIEECEGTNMNELRNVDSHMKRIRAKGQIKFVAHYGIGYALSDESLAMVRGILRRQQ